eukprot:scaffold821_cov123-Skeletonema_dohrnii-CCMP3373.AAC.9
MHTHLPPTTTHSQRSQTRKLIDLTHTHILTSTHSAQPSVDVHYCQIFQQVLLFTAHYPVPPRR